MDRETLAANIYAAWVGSDYANYRLGPKKAFRLADRFLREAERQRQKQDQELDKLCDEAIDKSDMGADYVEKAECYHKWQSRRKGVWQCALCKMFDEPASRIGQALDEEPPKPAPPLREFWVDFNSAGEPNFAWREPPVSKNEKYKCIKVRELPPGQDAGE